MRLFPQPGSSAPTSIIEARVRFIRARLGATREAKNFGARITNHPRPRGRDVFNASGTPGKSIQTHTKGAPRLLTASSTIRPVHPRPPERARQRLVLETRLNGSSAPAWAQPVALRRQRGAGGFIRARVGTTSLSCTILRPMAVHPRPPGRDDRADWPTFVQAGSSAPPWARHSAGTTERSRI